MAKFYNFNFKYKMFKKNDIIVCINSGTYCGVNIEEGQIGLIKLGLNKLKC